MIGIKTFQGSLVKDRSHEYHHYAFLQSAVPHFPKGKKGTNNFFLRNNTLKKNYNNNTYQGGPDKERSLEYRYCAFLAAVTTNK